MRGQESNQTVLFTFMSVDDRVPRRHPLRVVRSAAAGVLDELAPRLRRVYHIGGRAAMPAEPVLRAMLLWALYGIPSERRLLEELDYNLLYRWFAGLELHDAVWPRATFRANRQRLLGDGVAGEFFVRTLARVKPAVLANDHFTVNHPLIEAWCGQQRIDGVAR